MYKIYKISKTQHNHVYIYVLIIFDVSTNLYIKDTDIDLLVYCYNDVNSLKDNYIVRQNREHSVEVKYYNTTGWPPQYDNKRG